MNPDNNLISSYLVIFSVQLDFFFSKSWPSTVWQTFNSPHSAIPFPAAEQSQTKDSVAFNSLEKSAKGTALPSFLALMADRITIGIH